MVWGNGITVCVSIQFFLCHNKADTQRRGEEYEMNSSPILFTPHIHAREEQMEETNIVLSEEKCLKVYQRRKLRQMSCLCHVLKP